MNKERMLELAAFIRTLEHVTEGKITNLPTTIPTINLFCMNYFVARDYDGCGSAGCIAGAAVYKYAPLTPSGNVEAKGREVLDLDPDEAYALFTPDTELIRDDFEYEDVTPETAAQVVEAAAAGGEHLQSMANSLEEQR